jgi:tRNA1(Val) A37 N6-methylase TrmN6
VLELGSGAGVASLCLAARVPACTITGAEIDSELVLRARESTAANEMIDRVTFVEADVLKLPRQLCTAFDHVLCNPPFHDGAGERSPYANRARALQDFGDLPRWLETGLKRTAPQGIFTAILRADCLDQALKVLKGHGVSAFPLWSKRAVAAKRVLIQVRRGRRTPFALLPGLVLHEEDGRYTREADAILRGGAALVMEQARR